MNADGESTEVKRSAAKGRSGQGPAVDVFQIIRQTHPKLADAVDGVACALGEMILELLTSGECASIKEARNICSDVNTISHTSEDSSDVFFADWLFNGQHKTIQPVPKMEVESLIDEWKAKNIDIIANETQGNVRLWLGSEPKEMFKLTTRNVFTKKTPQEQAGALWVPLVFVGEEVTIKTIRRIFDRNPKQERDTVYNFQPHLRTLLGEELRDRVIERALDGRWEVNKKTWSFLWIRREKDPRSSKLIRRYLRSRKPKWLVLSHHDFKL